MDTIERVVAGAQVLKSARGEARDLALRVLDRFEG